MITHVIGLDLGQSRDYSACAVMQRIFTFPGMVRGRPPEPGQERLIHEIRALLRWKLGTPYDAIVQNVVELVGRVNAHGDCDQSVLVVDASGVGRPVVDMLRRQRLAPRAITITGGSSVGERENDMTVPQTFIASAFIVASQNGSLKISGKLSFAKELEKEINAFGYAVNRKSKTLSYESQQDNVNDDLVMACAIAYWFSTSKLPTRWTGAAAQVQGMDYADYDPLA